MEKVWGPSIRWHVKSNKPIMQNYINLVKKFELPEEVATSGAFAHLTYMYSNSWNTKDDVYKALVKKGAWEKGSETTLSNSDGGLGTSLIGNLQCFCKTNIEEQIERILSNLEKFEEFKKQWEAVRAETTDDIIQGMLNQDVKQAEAYYKTLE